MKLIDIIYVEFDTSIFYVSDRDVHLKEHYQMMYN